MNNNELIKSEIKFILTLHEQTKQALLNHYLINEPTKLSVDIGKSLELIDRMFKAELEYLIENPEDYISIYGTN
jgi:hypothetical protein